MIENEVWEKRTPKGMVRIRFAERDDLAGVIALRNSEPDLEQANTDDYRSELKKGGIVVAAIEGKIIGFSKFPSLIAIRPDFRKIGIGRVMAAFSMKFAKEIKYRVHFIGGHSDTMLKMFVEFEKEGILKIEEAVEIDAYNLELAGKLPHQRELKINIFRKKHGWHIAK
ncbi:TPA: hypothetical protein H1012_04325 [archaeon]|nr:hypothetical protein [Candidatus Naiadarchaeales archaeon SRR2090159.bin1288]